MTIYLSNTEYSNISQVKSAKNVQPNFMSLPNKNSSLAPLEKDTLQISSDVQDNQNKKNNAQSKALKIILGVGTVGLAAILLHKKLKPNEIQQKISSANPETTNAGIKSISSSSKFQGVGAKSQTFSTNPQTTTPKPQIANATSQTGSAKNETGSVQTHTGNVKLQFQRFKTVEEAKLFAKKHLNVVFDDSIKDPDLVNYLNSWFIKVYNQANGKVNLTTYPRIVANASNNLGKDNLFAMAEGIQSGGHTLGINVNSFEHFDEYLETMFQKACHKSRKVISEFDFQELYNTDYCKNLWKRVREFNNSTATFEDKLKLFTDLQRVQSRYSIVNGRIVPAQTSEFSSLWHELGHMEHWEKIPQNFSTMRGNSQIYNEFRNNRAILNTAGKVSPYAETNPLEFVAEVYAGLKEGCRFDQDVMDLYKFYNGPKVDFVVTKPKTNNGFWNDLENWVKN